MLFPLSSSHQRFRETQRTHTENQNIQIESTYLRKLNYRTVQSSRKQQFGLIGQRFTGAKNQLTTVRLHWCIIVKRTQFAYYGDFFLFKFLL